MVFEVRQIEDDNELFRRIAPNFFKVIAENIAAAKLAENADNTRIVIEKPFGNDLDSASALNKLLGGLFEEKRIVKSGLKDGEKVVSTRLQLLQAGMPVQPVEEKSEIGSGKSEQP